MRLSVFLLLLQLWGNVEVSLSQIACPTLPDVPHAHVSEETKRAEYQGGHMIHFTCEPGYTTSGTTIRYVCSSEGWLAIEQGTCSRKSLACPTLPDVPHAHVSEETKRAEYQGGHMIHFTCEPGYKISGTTIRYVCSSEGWLSIGQGTCSPCPTLPDVPHAHVSEETKRAEYQGGHVIHFTCEPGYKPSGPNIKYVCTSEGWLAVEQGTCSDALTCGKPPYLEGGDVTTSSNTEYSHGERVEYSCQNYYTMQGGPYKTCNNGEWTGLITCLKPCTANEYIMASNNIRLKHRQSQKLFSAHNDFIEFSCTRGRPVGTVEMRQRCVNGQMDFPTCE
ncbi:complement factor H-related protein 2-like isoform X6 [Centropristis striata]|uniref:complement factor H-related protein 2-like isoform X6 n=1 Tax=Centropristis striata TaxID=184440 RepID=UPI0027DF3D72|nr:complement factor H-related protein 2-like isoform X6 [Centropristis striata]